MRIVIKKCHICNNFFKGYPSRKQFTCSLKCRSRRWKMLEMFSLKNNSNWKGGKTKYSDGYIVIKDPLHPFSDKNGCKGSFITMYPSEYFVFPPFQLELFLRENISSIFHLRDLHLREQVNCFRLGYPLKKLLQIWHFLITIRIVAFVETVCNYPY